MNERLRKLRKTLDLTQREFGERLGVKGNTIAQYELGRNKPIDAVLSLICREFGVSEDWLRNGGSDDDMFIKLNEDEELAMYTQILLDSTDDIVADMIKEIIIMYGKLDNDSKQIIKNAAKNLLDKIKNT